MENGTYEEFRAALRAFESGWDRERYEAGIIADWQLDQWAGGMVEAFFPDYTSWADLTPAEWDMMSYRSMNTLGFVGYQFGEALLIDLGYYDDDFFYGAGAARNTWDGTWTGKNGVTSLEDFMTAEAQEIAIQEAFGFNLKVIEDGLGFAGESLDDYIGTTRSYVQNGQTVTVELTLTGIMAAAHLRGAWGTLALLEGGSVSTDEFGTSILRYIEQFGGYQAPSVAEAIALYEDRLTGDEGLGTPDGDTSPPTPPANDNTPPTPTEEVPQPAPADPGLGTAGVTAATADVVITWAWGTSPVVQGFDRASDTIFVSWVGADALEVSETAAGVVLAIPSNNQSNTLAGVTLASLSAANFTFLDATAAAQVLALVGAAPAAPDDTPPADDDDMPPMDDGDMPPTDDGDMDHGDMDHGDMPGMPHDHVMIGLDTPSRTVDGFDPMTGAIHLETGVTAARLQIFEESGDALGQTVRIQVLDDDGTPLSLTIITGIVLADLTLANFSIAEQSALNEVVSVLGTELATPDTGGFPVEYDSDGSAPPVITGTTPEGGNSWRVDANADDITGFDPAVDALDFGNISVHGLIATKTPLGEIALSSPWSPAIQIVQGVTYEQIDIASFGVVGNEHLRQDLGGVLSWERGIGPREPDTIYVRSHEYGVAEVVDGFDPATMKLSFLYFGTRERLSVEDSEAGLVISSLPTGQSLTLTGVTKAELVPGLIEFHHDQVVEDNLEVPFSFTAEQVTLVDRTMLLTPEAPADEITDGFQTRTGDLSPVDQGPAPTPPDDPAPDPAPDPEPLPDPAPDDGSSVPDDGIQRYAITWNWRAHEVVDGFNTATDVLDFGHMGTGQLAFDEIDGALTIEVIGNGGQIYVFEGVQAVDLSRDNFVAAPFNPVIDTPNGVIDQLQALALDDIA